MVIGASVCLPRGLVVYTVVVAAKPMLVTCYDYLHKSSYLYLPFSDVSLPYAGVHPCLGKKRCTPAIQGEQAYSGMYSKCEGF